MIHGLKSGPKTKNSPSQTVDLQGVLFGKAPAVKSLKKLWAAVTDWVTVMLDDSFVFRFKDGTEVEG